MFYSVKYLSETHVETEHHWQIFSTPSCMCSRRDLMLQGITHTKSHPILSHFGTFLRCFVKAVQHSWNSPCTTSPKLNLLFFVMGFGLAKRRQPFLPRHQRIFSSEQKLYDTALGNRSEEQEGREVLVLVAYDEWCFCSPGNRVSNCLKEASSFPQSDLFKVPDWVSPVHSWQRNEAPARADCLIHINTGNCTAPLSHWLLQDNADLRKPFCSCKHLEQTSCWLTDQF